MSNRAPAMASRFFVSMLVSTVVTLCLPAAPAAQTVSGKPGAPAPSTGESAAPGQGQQPAAAVTAYVIVDLTIDPKDPDATQIVSFRSHTVTSTTAVTCTSVVPPDPSGPKPVYEITQLAGLVDCAADTAVSAGNRAAAAAHIRLVAQAGSDLGTPRFISRKGEVVRVVVIDRAEGFFAKGAAVPFMVRGRKPTVTFNEQARETQFMTDLRALIQIAASLAAETGPDLPAPAEVTTKPVTWAFVSNHALRLTRATVTVTAEAGKQTSLLAKPSSVTDDQAALFIDEWEALQTPRTKCENGLPANARARAMSFFVLLCRAETGSVLEDQVSAIEGLGTLGDARAIPVLVGLTGNTFDVRVRTAALTALSKLKTPTAAAAAAPAKADEQPAKPTAQLITGPVEHWFLSADVPLNDVKALTFDKDTNQVSLGDEPSTFYIGINFLFGDLKDPRRSLVGNLVVKGMIKASNRPLDSFGAAIGLRGQYLSKWGLNLDALTPFVAVTATQEDVEEDGVIIRRARRNQEVRIGVSLNLDQAVKWVGGK
jgi:hypothetical protein